MLLAKLRTWQSLTPADRVCLRRALRLLPIVRLSLRVFGARRTQAWLARGNPLAAPAHACGEPVESTCGELVESTCGERVESTCGELAESTCGELAEPTEVRARQIVRMVRVARRYHRWWSNCLSHSLTLWVLLRREGIAADIRVGGRLRGGRFEAHAWVEWQGRALSEPGDDGGDFAVFDRPLIGRSSEKLG
jgi:hypothetical protein